MGLGGPVEREIRIDGHRNGAINVGTPATLPRRGCLKLSVRSAKRTFDGMRSSEAGSYYLVDPGPPTDNRWKQSRSCSSHGAGASSSTRSPLPADPVRLMFT